MSLKIVAGYMRKHIITCHYLRETPKVYQTKYVLFSLFRLQYTHKRLRTDGIYGQSAGNQIDSDKACFETGGQK